MICGFFEKLKRILFVGAILFAFGFLFYTVFYAVNRDFDEHEKKDDIKANDVKDEKREENDEVVKEEPIKDIPKESNVQSQSVSIPPLELKPLPERDLNNEIIDYQKFYSKEYNRMVIIDQSLNPLPVSCNLVTEEDNIKTKIFVSGHAYSGDKYIQSLNVLFQFDFSNYNLDKSQLSLVVNEMVAEMGDFSGFELNSGTLSNSVYINLVGSKNELMKAYPDDYSENGDFYYDNFMKDLLEEGFTCS